MARTHNLRPWLSTRIDRFSILPEEVARHILSFLNFVDLARVATVSKTCRRFYLSVLSLDFDSHDLYRRHPDDVELMNSLNSYFSHRGNNRIQRFHIRWSYFGGKASNEHIQVLSWIDKAARCEVEVLDIDFFEFPHSFAMPSSVLLSQSLRSLSICLNGRIFEAPSLSHLCNLHYLKLWEVKIVDESLFKWISCSCKCLEELELGLIRGLPNITIQSSSLKSLKVWGNDLFHLNICGEKIEDVQITWRKLSPRPSKKPPSKKLLCISAPKLRILIWESSLMKVQNIGGFLSLDRAVIFLDSALNEFDSVSKIICSISRAKVVILNDWTLKALSRECFMPTPCDNIYFFGVDLRNLNDDFVPTLVSLLRGYFASTVSWMLSQDSMFWV